MIPKFRLYDLTDQKMREVTDIDWSLEIIGTSGGVTEYDFDDVVLMQYTGLKDKNGVEIYEGDVIASQNTDRENWYVSHHVVVWHDTGFMGKQICSSSYIGLEHWTKGKNGYVVIGNIRENPELLKEDTAHG